MGCCTCLCKSTFMLIVVYASGNYRVSTGVLSIGTDPNCSGVATPPSLHEERLLVEKIKKFIEKSHLVSKRGDSLIQPCLSFSQLSSGHSLPATIQYRLGTLPSSPLISVHTATLSHAHQPLTVILHCSQNLIPSTSSSPLPQQ